eukprot:m.365963 g.365963  ORF g.365963 m.365963 type:complete len:51 (+) comp28091_c0_seq1:3978-4130(+)
MIHDAQPDDSMLDPSYRSYPFSYWLIGSSFRAVTPLNVHHEFDFISTLIS